MKRAIFIKKSKGFTLMELVIVLVIVGILSTISVPIYTSYIKKAYAAEGMSLCEAVATAEKVYFTENNSFVTNAGTFVGSINVNTSNNTYFRTFTVSAGASGSILTSYQIITSGVTGGKAAGVTVTYNGSIANPPTMMVTGL